MPKIKTHLKDLYRLKIEEKNRPSYLRLDMNESVDGLPESFVKMVISKINSNFLATYPEYRKLEEKIAEHNHLLPENICLSNGSDAAIKYIFDAFVNHGDKVLLTDPTFAMYLVYCRMFNAKPIIAQYNDFSFPVSSFIKMIKPGLKLAVLVNPNNPTGSIISPEDLRRILKKAKINNTLLVVDEAYFYFYPKTIIRAVKEFDNLIVLRTFSKLCGLATLRLGYAAADADIIESLRKVRPTFDVNGLAVLFAEKLLHKPEIIRAAIKTVNDGKKYLIQQLHKAKIEYISGQANFILIKCGLRAEEITEKLAKKRILISSGFKQSFLKNYIRVSVGSQKAMENFWNNFSALW